MRGHSDIWCLITGKSGWREYCLLKTQIIVKCWKMNVFQEFRTRMILSRKGKENQFFFFCWYDSDFWDMLIFLVLQGLFCDHHILCPLGCASCWRRQGVVASYHQGAIPDSVPNLQRTGLTTAYLLHSLFCLILMCRESCLFVLCACAPLPMNSYDFSLPMWSRQRIWSCREGFLQAHIWFNHLKGFVGGWQGKQLLSEWTSCWDTSWIIDITI